MTTSIKPQNGLAGRDYVISLMRFLLAGIVSVVLISTSCVGQNQSLVTHNLAYTNKDDPSKNKSGPDVNHFVIHLDDPYSQYIVGSTDPELLKDPTQNVRYSIQREVDSEFDEKTRIVSRTYLTTMITGTVPLHDFVYVTVSKTLDNKVLGIYIAWDNVTWMYW